MSRLMSVSLTEDAVRARTKTVTRRKGWTFLRPGDRLTLCRKVMGRKAGEPLERIAEVEVVDVRREPLIAFRYEDIGREGVPAPEWATTNHERLCRDCAVASWTGWYARTMGIPIDSTEVTRIEWRYL